MRTCVVQTIGTAQNVWNTFISVGLRPNDTKCIKYHPKEQFPELKLAKNGFSIFSIFFTFPAFTRGWEKKPPDAKLINFGKKKNRLSPKLCNGTSKYTPGTVPNNFFPKVSTLYSTPSGHAKIRVILPSKWPFWKRTQWPFSPWRMRPNADLKAPTSIPTFYFWAAHASRNMFGGNEQCEKCFQSHFWGPFGPSIFEKVKSKKKKKKFFFCSFVPIVWCQIVLQASIVSTRTRFQASKWPKPRAGNVWKPAFSAGKRPESKIN